MTSTANNYDMININDVVIDIKDDDDGYDGYDGDDGDDGYDGDDNVTIDIKDEDNTNKYYDLLYEDHIKTIEYKFIINKFAGS